MLSQLRINKLSLQAFIPFILLGAGSLFIVAWFRVYFSSSVVPSVDLHGHIYIVERLRESLLRGELLFYDPAWFSGWPAFQFYAFLPHLLAALLSYPLALFSAEPSRLAVHCLSVFACACLPWCIYFFISGFYKSFGSKALLAVGPKGASEKPLEKNNLYSRTALALVVVAVSFWFLNHDRQWYGIGGAAPLHVGLFSQAFGWLCFVVHSGLILRVISGAGRRTIVLCGISFFCLLLSHSLTAVYSGLMLALVFCWARENRRALFLGHLLGVALASFWLIPFLQYSGTYTALDIFRPTGDFFELFFRYPLHNLITYFRNLFSGVSGVFDPTVLFLWFFLALGLAHRAVRRSPHFFLFLSVLLLALVVFSSGFVASSIPMGFHYYRFHAYSFLLLASLLCWPLPAVVFSSGLFARKAWISVAIVFFVVSIVFNIDHPHYERAKVSKLSQNPTYLSDEAQVLEYLRSSPIRGRVMFEYFDNYSKFPFLSAHYMTSNLFKKTGREAMNGLFIQSSLAYRMPVVSAKLLGVKTYNTPLLFTDRSSLNDDVKVEQLRDFGVSTLVFTNESALKKLEKHLVKPVQKIGHYYIADILSGEIPLIEPIDKPLVAYFDGGGNLPFKHIQFFLYARDKFYPNLQLIKLEDLSDIPSSVQALFVNGVERESFDRKGLPTVYLNFQTKVDIDHYSVRYQHNVELDHFNAIESYLSRREGEIQPLVRSLAPQGRLPIPTATWSTYGSKLTLDNLAKGQFYRVNYSYFPYWSASGAEIYRGFGERIFVKADSSKVELVYSKASHIPTLLSWCISLSAIFICFKILRSPSAHPSP